MTWDSVYNFFHISDFIYFISSSQIQDMLFPIRLICIFCSVFFLVFVIYFMVNSSWLQYKFLEDVVEFFSWQTYGQREMSKHWSKIKKKTESGMESDYKLAIIDADDFLAEVLDNRGYEGDDLVDVLKKASKLIAPVLNDAIMAHGIRNSIVYNPDYKLPVEQAKKVLGIYEAAITSVGIS